MKEFQWGTQILTNTEGVVNNYGWETSVLKYFDMAKFSWSPLECMDMFMVHSNFMAIS